MKLLSCLSLLALAAMLQAEDHYRVYFGTYTGQKSKGIYRGDLDTKTGKLTNVALAAETQSPSFVAIHPSNKFLYAVGESGREGTVSAFSIDAKTGDLTLLNRQSAKGSGPCHIVVDKAGKNALIANYGSGSCAVLPIGSDGKLGEATGFQQHKGTSVDPNRQKGPHAHSINLDAANRFAFCADLGLDKVLIYRFDASKGTIEPNDPPHGTVPPGGGPRHFAFHPSGKYAYVCNEMTSSVTTFNYDAEKGALQEKQTVTTLPKETKGNSTAEIVVHPSGKFVYVSNRGHNSIAIFNVDPASGKLIPTGHQGKDIKTPRNFAIEPTGKFMLVANQGSGTVCVFKIDAESGKLDPVGDPVEVPAPVCVRFVPLAK
jgi:6-phosphogluconolactonase